MTELAWSSLLLARVSWFESMTRQFSGGNFRFGATHLVVVTLIAASLAALYWYLRYGRIGADARYNNPRALFHALCRAHALDRGSRRLLDQLARQQRLVDPARLFLEPERFEAANLGPTLKSQQARFAALRERLFAEPSVPTREASNERRRNGAVAAERRNA